MWSSRSNPVHLPILYADQPGANADQLSAGVPGSLPELKAPATSAQ